MTKAACKKTINWGFAYSFRLLLNDHDEEEYDAKQTSRQAGRQREWVSLGLAVGFYKLKAPAYDTMPPNNATHSNSSYKVYQLGTILGNTWECGDHSHSNQHTGQLHLNS